MNVGKLDASFSAAKNFISFYDGPHKNFFDRHTSFYALYHQGTYGPFDESKIELNVEPHFTSAWKNLGNMPEIKAKEGYIELLDSIVEGWRSWRPSNSPSENNATSSVVLKRQLTSLPSISTIQEELNARIDATNCRIEANEMKLEEIENLVRRSTDKKFSLTLAFNGVATFVGKTLATLTIKRVLKRSFQWLIPFICYFCINAKFRKQVLVKLFYSKTKPKELL